MKLLSVFMEVFASRSGNIVVELHGSCSSNCNLINSTRSNAFRSCPELTFHPHPYHTALTLASREQGELLVGEGCLRAHSRKPSLGYRTTFTRNPRWIADMK